MSGKKILIVDDDKIILRLLERDLASAGYSIIPTTSGGAAIKIVKREHPDLIILDIMMPDMDGGEVANVLKDYTGMRDIPIFFLSSLIKKEEEKCSTRRMCLISKPYNREELIKKIKQYLKN